MLENRFDASGALVGSTVTRGHRKDHAGAVEQRREVMERWAAFRYATVNLST
jgi:hypothetical protein